LNFDKFLKPESGGFGKTALPTLAIVGRACSPSAPSQSWGDFAWASIAFGTGTKAPSNAIKNPINANT
jgi:hypothetical protein